MFVPRDTEESREAVSCLIEAGLKKIKLDKTFEGINIVN